MSLLDVRQLIRLRQIALVSKDLKEAERILTKVLGTSVVYQDPHVEQWGLRNILMLFGGDVLEVVSPFQQGTTAGRLLDKRGNGGYMIIMQTEDALKRRDYIVQNNLAKVITSVEYEDAVIVQYHPKGIKGGVMPELDSHKPTADWPSPVWTQISPTITLGPMDRAPIYLAAMEHSSFLRLVGVVLRLDPGDEDTIGAAKQWEDTFGITRSQDQLLFTNARIGFVSGQKGEPAGIHSIIIAVNGKQRLERMLWSAKVENLCGDGYVQMLGVRWYFIDGNK